MNRTHVYYPGKWHVYLLRDPLGTVCWVGQTTYPSRRYEQHKHAVRNPGTGRGQGLNPLAAYLPALPTLHVVCVVETEEEALRIEGEYTSRRRALGDPLLNTLVGREGRVLSAESRAKISAANLARGPMLRTPESCENISRAVSATWKKRSPAERQRIADKIIATRMANKRLGGK